MTLLIVLFAGLTLSGCAGSSAERLHPRYDIGLDDLKLMVEPLPEQIRQSILDDPVCFLERLSDVLELSDELFLIADKNHNLGPDYVPTDLVSLDGYPLVRNREGMMLRAVTIPDLLAMNEAAKQEGVRLVYSSAYRSYDYQEMIYRRNVNNLGQEQADRESARPGASQHQMGTAVDFGSITDAFADTPAGKWLYEHAWKYGFSLSYPDGYESVTGYRHEIWHYRYITRPAAYLERFYFDSVQHYLLSFIDSNGAVLRRAYHGNRGEGPAGAVRAGQGDRGENI